MQVPTRPQLGTPTPKGHIFYALFSFPKGTMKWLITTMLALNPFLTHAVEAAAPPGSAILEARLYDGTKLSNQICRFYYPFSDMFKKDVDKINDSSWWKNYGWSGSCQNGFLHGKGDLGKVLRNGVWLNIDYPSILFENGIQTGHLQVAGSDVSNIARGIVLSGDASNFGFVGMFSVKGAISHATYNDNRLWKNGPHHPSWWDNAEKTQVCNSNQTLQQCQWAATYGDSIRNRISDAQTNGQCKLLAGLMKEANSAGGSDYINEDAMKYCAENAAFFSLVNGSDPQKMFLSAGQYESRGDRGRAKTIYNSIVSRFPKSSVAVHATNRLTALSDVEAVENAGYRASAANREAADSVRSQNYQQCLNNQNACYGRCSGIKDFSARQNCQSGCAICQQ